MSSLKRKIPEDHLQRRVRARREASEDLEVETSESTSEGDDQEPEGSDAASDDNESEVSESELQNDAANISFGALAKAQAALSKSSKKTRRPREGDDGWTNDEALERKAGRKDHRELNRSSKHAPTEISSKKAVSRKREVVPVKKRDVRDPRFEPTSGPIDDTKLRRAYSFLDTYREDEMKELKNAIKATKDEEAKEKLKRALLSMESKKKAQIRRDKEQEVLDRHRKEEKELVKQGKKPFYLKKAEQKKRLLLDQYGELKGKQLDKAIERRRKKVEGKEKKNMPFARRSVDA